MKLDELITALKLEVLCLSNPEKVVDGVYTGDLLSLVMSRLKSGNVWVTIMNNVNIVAVASLTGASCVIIAENSDVDCEVIDKASVNHVNILRTPKSSYEICCMLKTILDS